MSHLLHIDSSARYEDSVTRWMTAWFVENWKREHPHGQVTTLDLAREPFAHFSPNDMHRSAEPRADGSNADFVRANETLKAADTVIIGAPMYNYAVPSTLKAWIDRICLMTNFPDAKTGATPLGANKQIIVVTARGGSYAKGTPREAYDFQTPYLSAVFSTLGLGKRLTFVHTEMTLAATVPALAQFKEIGEQSHANAREALRTLARQSPAVG